MKCYIGTWTWTDNLECPKQYKFGIWNLKSPYRPGSPTRTHGRPMSRRVDNIEMDLKETEWEVLDWIAVTQDREKW